MNHVATIASVPRLPRSRAERTSMSNGIFLSFTTLLICLGVSKTCPAEKPWNQKPRPEKIENDYVRAGAPWEIHRWAKPTYTPAYDYGYIGGGAAFNWGQPRTLEEGTWGRDYVGTLYPRRVWLNWWHGARYQGGTGGYATDGPKLRRE